MFFLVSSQGPPLIVFSRDAPDSSVGLPSNQTGEEENLFVSDDEHIRDQLVDCNSSETKQDAFNLECDGLPGDLPAAANAEHAVPQTLEENNPRDVAENIQSNPPEDSAPERPSSSDVQDTIFCKPLREKVTSSPYNPYRPVFEKETETPKAGIYRRKRPKLMQYPASDRGSIRRYNKDDPGRAIGDKTDKADELPYKKAFTDSSLNKNPYQSVVKIPMASEKGLFPENKLNFDSEHVKHVLDSHLRNHAKGTTTPIWFSFSLRHSNSHTNRINNISSFDFFTMSLREFVVALPLKDKDQISGLFILKYGPITHLR
ncbi:hypothetical protein FVEN_g11641 [Fusarium venenatum]|nr:hypothetical protein FVEN_g11641 [Fusarium venenatum]